MRAKSRPWTEEERELLIETVKDNPQNYSKAFREVSATIGRSVMAVSSYWYNVLSKHQGIWMAVVTENKTVPNKKVLRGDNNDTSITTVSLWQKIKRLFTRN